MKKFEEWSNKQPIFYCDKIEKYIDKGRKEAWKAAFRRIENYIDSGHSIDEVSDYISKELANESI